jgi:predicted O-linked N-acetylglucosamine transferase (SPINDLY family)
MSHRRQQASSKAAAATTAVADLLGAGMKCHQAGRLADAEAYYRQVLTVEPNDADALNMLGVVAQQVGRSELAVGLIRQAIRNNGSNPAYFYNLGHVLREQGKVEEVISAIRRAIGIKPDIAERHFSLGMAVRVVTLRGDRHAGRIGTSLLTQIGLTDLIADSIEAYVAISVALAGDPTRLADLRRLLRPRIATSSLCDATAFARKVEEAYRTMWARWCAAPALPSREAAR